MQYFLDMKQGKSAAAAQATTPTPTASSATTAGDAAMATSTSTTLSDAVKPLLQWLRETLPHLPEATLRSYSSVLANAGYDHPNVLPHLQLEDIPSIPKGHGRAIIHAAKAATTTGENKR